MNAVERLLEWLRNTSEEDADELWSYFDGSNDVAIQEMIKVISESHPNLS